MQVNKSNFAKAKEFVLNKSELRKCNACDKKWLIKLYENLVLHSQVDFQYQYAVKKYCY